MPLPNTRAGIGLGVALGLVLAAGCNSDEKPRSAVDDTDDTGVTDEPSDTEDTDDTDTGPPPDKTCRDGVQCMLACAATYPQDPGPEDPTLEDFYLGCFLGCGKDLDGDEALAMIELTSCVSDKCYANGTCGADPPTDVECAACFFIGLNDQMSEGCEDEAAACT